MPDSVNTSTRSRMMAGIRGKNTRPELKVRSALHRRGFRFRLHGAGIPGRPDIVFSSRSAVIFVHGCFWHRHQGCHWCTDPEARGDFWEAKFRANVERDHRQQLALLDQGWRVGIVWECATRTKGFEQIVEALCNWLDSRDRWLETNVVRSRPGWKNHLR